MSSSACASSGAGVVERAAIEWGIASRCASGEAKSGDVGIVTLVSEGALVAGIDGIGHGREATRAAHRAADVVRDSAGLDLVKLVGRCHDVLRGTRGAAISLAFVSRARSEVTWVGVGNVEGRVLSGDPSATRPKAALMLARGVPGHDLPVARTTTLAVRPGDVLVLATDGIRAAFADSLNISGTAQAISDRILAEHWKRPDDALVVSARYLGDRQ